MIIEVTEFHKGLSESSNYYFVIEGEKLVHITSYSISFREYDGICKYKVDLNSLKGKKIVEIMSSNSGLFPTISIYSAEEFIKDFKERSKEKQPLSYLNNFRFSHLTQNDYYFLDNYWRKYYMPMINEIKFITEKWKKPDSPDPHQRVGLFSSSLILNQLRSNVNFPLSFIIPYDKSARSRSLDVLTKELHQIWLALKLIDSLANFFNFKTYSPFFYQSLTRSIASWYNAENNIFSLWYELDIHPLTGLGGILWNQKSISTSLEEIIKRGADTKDEKGLKHYPTRSDFVILKGAETYDEFKKGFEIVALIECKNWEYESWSKDLKRIVSYKQVFQPKHLILASLKEVSSDIVAKLEKEGITIIDEVFPGGNGEKEIIEKIIQICK